MKKDRNSESCQLRALQNSFPKRLGPIDYAYDIQLLQPAPSPSPPYPHLLCAKWTSAFQGLKQDPLEGQPTCSVLDGCVQSLHGVHRPPGQWKARTRVWRGERAQMEVSGGHCWELQDAQNMKCVQFLIALVMGVKVNLGYLVVAHFIDLRIYLHVVEINRIW